MKKIINLSLLMLFVLVLGLSSCGKNKLKDVTFTKEPTTLYVGEEFKFEFTKQDDVVVEWLSSNESVATVVDGKVSALQAGETVVKAVFTLKKETKEYTFNVTVLNSEFNVTYENDGEYEESKNPTSYSVFNLPVTLVNPTSKGSVFLGWYLNDVLVTEIPAGTTGDIKLVAKWEKHLNINYVLNGGKNPDDAPKTFIQGVGATLPIPTRENYEFLGWSTKIGGTDYITEISNKAIADVKVYANWKKLDIYSTINYVCNGGRIDEVAPEMYLEGTVINLPIPVKAGYDFIGWTTEENSTKYTFVITANQTGDLTLYANWKVDTTFDITYVYTDGELPSKPATTFEELEASFWPAFQAWCKDTTDVNSFKEKVLAAWSKNADGGYKLYLPAGQGIQDPNYFVNDPETPKFWYDWFLAIDSQINKINNAQSAWTSTYVGYMRLYQFFTGNTGLWTAERREVVYNACLCATPLVTSYEAGEEKELVNLVIDDGRTFLGWYDENGNKIEKITSDLRGDLVLTAMWSASTPAESFELTKVEKLGKFETFQLTWILLPADTTNKNIIFTSSNPDILSIDKHAVMYGNEVGTVTVTYEVLANPELSGSFTVEVYVNPFIDATFDTTSIVGVGSYININATIEAGTGEIVWESLNPNIATVDESGQVYGKASGYAEIIASIKGNKDAKLVLGVTVMSQEDEQLYSVLANAHNAEVYYVNDLNVAYDYDTTVACSASDLYFNYEYKENTNYYIDPNRKKMSSIEFITVHYSGMPKAHQDGEVIAQALYNSFHNDGANWGGTSWHYSTGNDGVFYSMDDTTVAWHAGDGTGTAFKWIDTGVQATSNTKPTFAIVANKAATTGYSYSVNGVVTNIEAPGNYRLTFFGPTWKIENGKYYMGNTYYSQSYGYISSRGGNLNSIGIETACNYGSDLWMTYHITAQLVARLLVKTNLDITRVQGHHTFSGKDCPQTLLEGEGELWYKFMDLIEAELALYKTMQDYTITSVSSNKEYLQDSGRVSKMPNYTETVTYTLTVKNNKTGVTKELKFSSVIHGLYTL